MHSMSEAGYPEGMRGIISMKSVCAAWIGFLWMTSAFAAGSDHLQLVTTSGGIVSSSWTTAVFENPAGLPGNSGFRLTGQGGSDSSFDHPFAAGGILLGNKNFGAAAGARQTFEKNRNSTSAFYGLGIRSTGLRASLGAAGTTKITPDKGSSFNAGVKLEPLRQIQLGVTAFGIDGGVDEWGAGIGIGFGNDAMIVVDATANKDLKELAFQPGVTVAEGNAALTLSYGFKEGSQQLSKGFSAGGGLMFGKSTLFQVYYNHLAKYYATLSFMF